MIAKNLEGPSQQAYERTLPIQLDEFALTTLWRGINASSKKILEMFAENDGAVHVIEFMDALHLETPRQLTGPLGGITRKLRKIFGANVNVALWTYDKNEHVYLLLDGHLPILRDFLGMSWAFYEKQRNEEKISNHVETDAAQTEEERICLENKMGRKPYAKNREHYLLKIRNDWSLLDDTGKNDLYAKIKKNINESRKSYYSSEELEKIYQGECASYRKKVDDEQTGDEVLIKKGKELLKTFMDRWMEQRKSENLTWETEMQIAEHKQNAQERRNLRNSNFYETNQGMKIISESEVVNSNEKDYQI